MGNLDDAIADEMRAGDSTAHYDRAIACRRKKQYAQALADMSEAIRQKPQNALYDGERAVVLSSSGDQAGALTDYDRALAQDPEDGGYLNARAGRAAC